MNFCDGQFRDRSDGFCAVNHYPTRGRSSFARVHDRSMQEFGAYTCFWFCFQITVRETVQRVECCCPAGHTLILVFLMSSLSPCFSLSLSFSVSVSLSLSLCRSLSLSLSFSLSLSLSLSLTFSVSLTLSLSLPSLCALNSYLSLSL